MLRSLPGERDIPKLVDQRSIVSRCFPRTGYNCADRRLYSGNSLSRIFLIVTREWPVSFCISRMFFAVNPMRRSDVLVLIHRYHPFPPVPSVFS